MHYEINVALDGRHFFATDKRSCTSAKELLKVLNVFKEKFRPIDGYSIEVSYHPGISYGIRIGVHTSEAQILHEIEKLGK